MKKKFFSILTICIFISAGISCGKRTGNDQRPNTNSTQTGQSKADIQTLGRGRNQEPGQGQDYGRGQGGLGLGRGKNIYARGRGWGRVDEIGLTEKENSAIEIKTVKAEYKPLRSQLVATGKVIAHPYRKAIVSYAFPARIAQIHVRIGDWVKSGQELVTLQSEEVGNAKSEFYKTQADYELAQVNYERQKRLYDRGVGAQKDYLAAEAEFKVAEANLNAAEKKLHVLGFTESQIKEIAETHQINPVITLFAPIRGKIIENNAILGAMVDQATEILTILDPTILCVDADLYEKDIAKIREGQFVEALVPAYPGEKFVGKICYISDVLNEETRTITVRAEMENQNYKLKPGMFADIGISLNHATDVLVVPEEAILDDKDNKIVFVKQDNKFFLHVVETGAKENNYVEIISGLSEGDFVVTDGNFQLKSKMYEEILKKGQVH